LNVLNKSAIGKVSKRQRQWLIAGALLFVALAMSGCHTLEFYGQAVKGQYQIFAHQKSIARLLADPNTPRPLKQRFELLNELRGFASNDLRLPTDDHYRKYVDLQRPYVVWNVEAAPEFSMEPKTWWYPLLGSLEYRGYFSKAGATNYANWLRARGYDVSVGGVTAYSTLGWFKDPVLNTFIFEDDAELAEVIFHELAHQRLFARGDTDFNEAFATTVGQEGVRRWLKATRPAEQLDRYVAHLRHSDQFVHLVMKTRASLERLYGDQVSDDGKIKPRSGISPDTEQALRTQKAQVLEEMRAEFLRLKTDWNGDADYDGWFKHPVNNAHLNSVAAYYDFVPGFEQLLAENDGDTESFYNAAEQLSKKPKTERHEQLRILARTKIALRSAR
jgi:predicted aminopeptidase